MIAWLSRSDDGEGVVGEIFGHGLVAVRAERRSRTPLARGSAGRRLAVFSVTAPSVLHAIYQLRDMTIRKAAGVDDGGTISSHLPQTSCHVCPVTGR